MALCDLCVILRALCGKRKINHREHKGITKNTEFLCALRVKISALCG
jgi:hypothetical protein